MSSSSSNRSIPTEDRVSALPDSILSHILSFLPTKNSAATTILSKRWKPLWLSVLDLDFDGESFKDFNTFRHVVYSVILSRQLTLPIRSFRFKCCNRHGLYDINDVNRFINAALERRIENLELNMMCWPIDHIQVKLISSIFSCKTLTLLKLNSVILNNLPPQIDLPLLKTLQFDCVRFMSYEEIIKFFQGCPILEELQTRDVYVVPQVTMIPSGSRIKHLSNLITATLSGNIYIHFFLLSAVQILSVKLIWHLYLRVPTFQNLTQMELFFCTYNGRIWGDKWRWMLDVLHHSPKLQHLTIHQEMEKGIYHDKWQDPQNVPTCISSQLRTCLFKDCKGRNSELQFAEYVMQNSKVLRTMTIHSACSIDLLAKHQMLKKLAVCPRSCKLIFD